MSSSIRSAVALLALSATALRDRAYRRIPWLAGGVLALHPLGGLPDRSWGLIFLRLACLPCMACSSACADAATRGGS
jgi:hypothetical protein